MPFFVVGQLMKPYRLRNDIELPYTGDYTESSLRDIILKNISLVSHNNIKASTLLSKENFLNFLATQKDITSQQVIDNDQFEDVASLPDETEEVLSTRQIE